ncbi:hypothetical protein [Helicobacter ganmani]
MTPFDGNEKVIYEKDSFKMVKQKRNNDDFQISGFGRDFKNITI